MTGKANFLTVVSGLPRSGTSMMMRVLEAGGLAPQTDELRHANEDNPNGYYEYEPVKQLPHHADWVYRARGKAVKIIYKLVSELPPDVPYRIVFMQRNVDEVVRSQEKMLERGGQDPQIAAHDAMVALFGSDIAAFHSWANAQDNIRMLPVDYRSFIETPEQISGSIAAFLEMPLDVDAMAAVVDPDLYRNRA